MRHKYESCSKQWHVNLLLFIFFWKTAHLSVPLINLLSFVFTGEMRASPKIMYTYCEIQFNFKAFVSDSKVIYYSFSPKMELILEKPFCSTEENIL